MPHLADVYAAAQLRQDHEPHKLVIQPHRLPGLVPLLLLDAVYERKRVHLAAAALVDALLDELGVRVGGAGRIGRQHNLLPPHLDRRRHGAVGGAAASGSDSAHARKGLVLGCRRRRQGKVAKMIGPQQAGAGGRSCRSGDSIGRRCSGRTKPGQAVQTPPCACGSLCPLQAYFSHAAPDHGGSATAAQSLVARIGRSSSDRRRR